MTFKALCFDQSTAKTGWTLGTDKSPPSEWISGRFRAPRRDDDGERLIIIEDSVLELIDRFSPDLIVYEQVWDPSFDAMKAVQAGVEPRRNFSRETLNLLVMVKGVILMAAARRSIPTEGHAPRSWRSVLKLPQPPWADDQGKPLTGEQKRKWTKRETVRAVKRLGARVETEDEADSFGLCLYALTGKPGIARATADLFERAKATL